MSDRERIVETCKCGAQIDFQARRRQTYQEQHEADNDILSRFRTEHRCVTPDRDDQPKEPA